MSLKKTEVTQHNAKDFLAALVASSDDAIIGKTLSGVIVSWNRAAEKLFGYTPEEAVGQHIHLIIPKDRENEEHIILGKIRSGERIDHFETLRRKKNGEMINIALTVSPIKNKRGKIVGASKIARDITTQKQFEAMLVESSKRKDEFLANISHELRTPMNAVIGLANILCMSQSLTDKEKLMVTTLKQSADSLMGLINNLLDFSKLEAGNVELEQVEFSLPEIVESTMGIIKVRAEEKGISMSLSYAPELKKYYIGDSFKLQQVLMNILSNAVKFTDQGSVAIKVEAHEEEHNKAMFCFKITDTGIGISDEKLSLIFDKFTQADASTTRQYGGSGLGLAITKALVNAMDGFIDVQSRLGLGTVFNVKIPFINSDRHSLVEASAIEEEKTRKNILLVDDYEPNILVVTTLLDQLGYDYNVAENGAQAVQRFQRDKYDVILMDLQMPQMDGYESTNRIRALEKQNDLPVTPIVAITAHVLEKDRQKCREAGMNDFIPKPFDPDVLKKILAQYIQAGNQILSS